MRKFIFSILMFGIVAALGGPAAVALDDGTPDYVRSFGILDQEKFDRLKRFNNMFVTDIAKSSPKQTELTVPVLALVAIANKDSVERAVIFPAAKDTGMNFDLLTDPFPPGSYWSGKFDAVGTYTFNDAANPEKILGVIHVEPAK